VKYYLTKWKQRLARLLALLLVFGLTAAVLSFVSRRYGPFLPDTEIPPDESDYGRETDPPNISPPDTSNSGESSDPSGGSSQEQETDSSDPEDITSVKDIIDTTLLSAEKAVLMPVSHWTGQGYSLLSDGDWTGGMQLGEMQFAFKLPEKYTVNTHTVDKVQYVYPENNSEHYATTVQVTEDRPAIALYMGYIIYDRGDKLFLINNRGVTLLSFDDTQTIPAYTRDKNGVPLFYRNLWSAEKGMEKIYYRLSEDEKSFILADYNDLLDGRGLYFDYPASYGIPTNNTYLVAESEEAVKARLEAEAQRVAALTPEELAAEEEDRKVNKTVNAAAYEYPRLGFTRWDNNYTGLIFRNAYNYSEGLAAVTADGDRQALYFISQYGYIAASGSRTTYRKDYERYVIESWRLPVSFGIESIGSLYFDHGLVRVRKQTMDYGAYISYDNIRIISDEDILIDKKGNVFPIPSGYVLKGYSCGVILLEKDGKYGFMDYTGDWIAQPVYSSATPFLGGLATLTTPDGRVGMIDTKGNIVLPFAYDAITSVSSGLVAAFHPEDGWQILKILAK